MSIESAYIEDSDIFGNYLIHGIDEIIVPDAVSWWPSAPGWSVLCILILLWLLALIVRWLKYQWRNRYRAQALRQLEQVQKEAGNNLQPVLALLPYCIKVTALQAYPRQNVASLSGHAWLAFLDAHYSGPSFSTGVGEKLLSIAYLPEEDWQLDEKESRALIKMSRRWIKKHIEVSGDVSGDIAGELSGDLSGQETDV
jgi:hypothetical protein